MSPSFHVHAVYTQGVRDEHQRLATMFREAGKRYEELEATLTEGSVALANCSYAARRCFRLAKWFEAGARDVRGGLDAQIAKSIPEIAFCQGEKADYER